MSVSQSYTANLEECHSIITSTPDRLLILTQNVRSISRNMAGLELILHRLKLKCDILILTECWLQKAPDIPYLAGYSRAETKNNTKQNDGVVIYYKENLNVSIMEPDFTNSNCLVAVIEKRIAVIAMYRSPSYTNLDPFMSFLDNTLKKLSSYNYVVVMGDINVAINPNKIGIDGERYLTLAASHGLLPTHTLVTRSASQTCLDHALIKSKGSSITIVPHATLTDHHPVILSMYLKRPRQYAIATKTKINAKGLAKDLLEINFEQIYQTTDPNTNINYLTTCLQEAISKNTQLVQLPRRQKILNRG